MSNPEEAKIMAQIEADKAAGRDPFGDDDVAVADEPVTDTLIEPVKEDESPVEVVDAAPEIQLESLQKPTNFKTEAPTEYKTQRTELVKEKSALMKKLMDGELDADEFATQESAISDKLEDLTAQRIRSETLQEANVQSAAQYQQREIQRLIALSKSDIDYTTDIKAQKQFDAVLSAIGQDPDNAGRDYSDILSDAHKVVLALRGIMTKGDKVDEAVKSRIPEAKPPVTLRNIPSASTPNANGDMLDQLGRLTGQAYQDAFAKLTQAQRRTLLDEE